MAGRRHGDERSLQGASPLSEAFTAYATGPRAGTLLGVSADWWLTPDTIPLRYEDLVRDTQGQMARVIEALGVSPAKSPDEVVAKSAPSDMRSISVNWLYHVWHAQPGLWKRLLCAREARQIYAAQPTARKIADYACDPDELLTAAQAQQQWERMESAATRRTLYGVRRMIEEDYARREESLANVLAEIAAMSQRLAETQAQLTAARSELTGTQSQLAEAHRQLSESAHQQTELARQFAELPWQQIRQLGEMGPSAFRAAHSLQRWSRRFPRLAGGVKSLAAWTRVL